MEEFGLRGHPRPRVTVELANRFDIPDIRDLRVGLLIERGVEDGLRREILSAVRSALQYEDNR